MHADLKKSLGPGQLWFAMLLPSVITFIYFVYLREHPSGWQQIAYVIGKTAQFSLPLFLLRAWEPGFWSSPTSRPATVFNRWWYVGLASGAVIAAVILAAYYVIVRDSLHAQVLTQQLQDKLRGLELSTPIRYLLMSLFYCFIHSFLEEYYWRWFVFRQWTNHISVTAAILLSSLAFMAHHVIVLGLLLGWTSWLTAVVSIGTAIGGGFWAWLYWRSGSLIPSWLSHFIVDAAIMGVGFTVSKSMF